MTITLSKVRISRGVAGQFSATVTVTYDDEAPSTISFVGSTFGGPVVMVSGDRQTFVSDPSRFGDFAKEPAAWVGRFFTA